MNCTAKCSFFPPRNVIRTNKSFARDITQNKKKRNNTNNKQITNEILKQNYPHKNKTVFNAMNE